MGRKKSMKMMKGGVRSLGDDTKDCSVCGKQFIPDIGGATSNICAECAQSEQNLEKTSASKVHVFNLEQYVEGPRMWVGSERWKKLMVKIIQRPGEEWKIYFGYSDVYPVKDFEFRKQNLQATRRRDIDDEKNKRVIILQKSGMENLGYLGRWVVMARDSEQLTKLKNILREAGAEDKIQSTEEISLVSDSTVQSDNEDSELSSPSSDGSGQAGGKKESKKKKSKKRKSTKKRRYSKKRKTKKRKTKKRKSNRRSKKR